MYDVNKPIDHYDYILLQEVPLHILFGASDIT